MISMQPYNPRHLKRSVKFGNNMVCTSNPLAESAGLEALSMGGNAVDAAVATAMVLTVVEPTMNGIGGDAFAQIWDGRKLHGLNGSGRSPQEWSLEWMQQKGLHSIPLRGWQSVTVPGGVSAWIEIWRKFGTLPLSKLANRAISYAREGFPVSPITALLWAKAPQDIRSVEGFDAAFFPNGKAPLPGEIFKFPDQGDTLALIADSEGEEFYRGTLARAIADDAKKHGSALTIADLESHSSDWVEPIDIEFCGSRLHELPPNGQGIAALIAIGILKHAKIDKYPLDSIDSTHLQIEAVKLAYADLAKFVGDKDHMTLDCRDLLTDAYLAHRASQINMSQAQVATHGPTPDGGTVYLSTADSSGMMVSFIQSNWWGFGSGVVVPGTGISLHNRGTGFNGIKGHPNCIAGKKRPFHTIIPGFVTKRGRGLMAFGVMGGSFQAQGHVQQAVRILLHRQIPQEANDAPRWRYVKELEGAHSIFVGII